MFIRLTRTPFLFFNSEGEDGGGKTPSSEDLGFPADTKPEDMTAEEQLAYWKNDAEKWKSLSKKHEKNRKPKTFDDDMAELEKLRAKQDENLEPDAKAIKDAADAARAAGRSEGVSTLLLSAVRAEFKSRAPHLDNDELDELMEDIDVTPERFLSDGELDTERINRLAKKLAPAPAPANDEDNEGDDKLPKFGLGHVLRGGVRQKGKGQSLDSVRASTLAKYQKTDQ